MKKTCASTKNYAPYFPRGPTARGDTLFHMATYLYNSIVVNELIKFAKGTKAKHSTVALASM